MGERLIIHMRMDMLPALKACGFTPVGNRKKREYFSLTARVKGFNLKNTDKVYQITNFAYQKKEEIMKTSVKLVLAMMLMMFISVSVFAQGQQAVGGADYPERPIDVVLGWSAGGTSDTTVRAIAREMSEFFDVEIRINNMDGANGGIAYTNVVQSPADGYRWFGGAQVQATYPITKQSKFGWEEMYSFPAGMGATTIYVRTDSGYDDINDLVDAIKSSNRPVNYGTTSRGGNGSIFGAAFAQAAGIEDKVREVPYDGGREAGNYLIAGEVEYISVSLGDVSDWAEEGTLKPLLNLFKEDYVWRGVTFPSIMHDFPELELYTSINPYWGIAVPRDVSEDVLVKIAEAFAYAVEQDRFKAALEARGIIVAPLMGKEADEAAAIVGAGRGWAQYEYDIVDTAPSQFNIPKLNNWKFPYDDVSAGVRPWPEEVEAMADDL